LQAKISGLGMMDNKGTDGEFGNQLPSFRKSDPYPFRPQ
ncbi:unnamed protein product, partial [marine sediment metagenome]